MGIKTSSDLLKTIRSLDDIQLNKQYRKEYIAGLKEDLRMARARNKVGIRGFTKAYIRSLEVCLRNIDKDYPFLGKIKVSVGK